MSDGHSFELYFNRPLPFPMNHVFENVAADDAGNVHRFLGVAHIEKAETTYGRDGECNTVALVTTYAPVG